MQAGLKLLLLVATIFAAALGARYALAQEPGRILPALFEFTDGSNEFVFELRDPAKIALARKYLASQGAEPLRIAGRIAEAPVPHNARWSFHLAPGTVQFFGASIEVCNASIHAVQENLAYVGGTFLPGGWWCPWDSRLTRELSSGQYVTLSNGQP